MSEKLPKLLTRDEFRNGVFKRDNNLCVICGNPAQDSHHIIERRLWSNGGYFLDNGASLCGTCHIRAEETTISVEEIREKAGIRKALVPDHLYPDLVYDKWGNEILSNGNRAKGELFDDESVQKILGQGGVLNLFVDPRYPRTMHLPWSGGVGKDDRVIDNLDCFKGKRVIVSVKMDGENTTLKPDRMHARSPESKTDESRTWMANYWAVVRHDIPPGWRVCGENLYAGPPWHVIKYVNLPKPNGYFLGFSVWNDRNVCLSWDETRDWFSLMNIAQVPVIYDGIWDERLIRDIYPIQSPEALKYSAIHEGYVVRLAEQFHYRDFRRACGKFVHEDFRRVVDANHGVRQRVGFQKNELEK
jgi:hypothetical protein